MKSRILRFFIRIFPVFLIVSVLSFPNVFAQGDTGILQGKVTTMSPNGDSISLPGATVTLRGTGQSSSEAKTIVADDAGIYKFSDLPEGNYSLEVSLSGFISVKKMITVSNNQSVTENVQLELDGINASVTVEAETDSINKTDSTVAETLVSTTLAKLPLAQEQFQDALPLIPGLVRGPDGLINVKGAQSSQNGTLVGRANGDDPITGNAAVNLPLEAVESVQVTSNPYSAEFGNFSGGVVQLQTKSGSNEWKYGLTNFFPRLRKRGGAIRGIESIAPRLTFSGPIKKDKFFFFQSFEYRRVQTRVESLPPLKSDSKLESFNSFSRVDYNPSDRNRLNVSFALFPQKIDYLNLNTFNPQETAANFHQRGWLIGVSNQYVTLKGGILETNLSVKRADADVFGNSTAQFTIAPQTNSGGFFNRQHRASLRYEAQSIYSLPTFNLKGQHSLKFGGGFGYTNFDGVSVSSDVRIARINGGTSQVQTYSGSGILSRRKSEYGFFVQDKWMPNQRLTFDFGIRLDGDNFGKTLNPAPRAGFVFSPFVDNKTIIRGGAGLFFLKIPINVGVFEQNQSVSIRRFAADGVSQISTIRYRNVLADGDIKTPYSTGLNLQVDREVSDRLLIRVGYEQRETRRDFLINPILETNGSDGIYQLGGGGKSSYRELLLMGRIRLQKNRDLFVSYTRSRAAGDLNTFGSYAGNISNPILRANEYSRLAFDVPHRLLFWGDVGLPFKINFSPVVDWRSGFPFSVVDEDQNFIGKRNFSGRYPKFFSADIQLARDFTVPFRDKEYIVRAGIKIFNLTNHFNPRDIQNNISDSNFGSFYNGVGRIIRMKIEFRF